MQIKTKTTSVLYGEKLHVSQRRKQKLFAITVYQLPKQDLKKSCFIFTIADWELEQKNPIESNHSRQ